MQSAHRGHTLGRGHTLRGHSFVVIRFGSHSGILGGAKASPILLLGGIAPSAGDGSSSSNAPSAIAESSSPTDFLP